MPKMNIVRVHSADEVKMDTVDVPQPGPRDIVVKVHACGICGSDPFYIATESFVPEGQPMPLGHEFSGTVHTVGDEVLQYAVGQKVVVDPYHNQIGNGGLEGGFAPYVLVRDVVDQPDMVIQIPDGLSMEHGALVEPLAVSMHGVNRSRIKPGQKAVIFGAGPIGLGAVVALRDIGIDQIVIADQSPQRLAVAEQLGASTCNVSNQDLREFLHQQQGDATVPVRGETLPDTDVYIEATGVGAVLEQCIGMAKEGARLAILSVHKALIQLDPLLLLTKEIELIGSRGYPSEFNQVL